MSNSNLTPGIRVGHLILSALAIQESDPQNALAWTSLQTS